MHDEDGRCAVRASGNAASDQSHCRLECVYHCWQWVLHSGLRGDQHSRARLPGVTSRVLLFHWQSAVQGGLPPVEGKGITQTEDILNRILPPREWTNDGQLWVQYVSSTPATRLDVINLQEKLDQQLQQRQARETGHLPCA